MNIDKTTKRGSITFSLEAIAGVAVNSCKTCYGFKAMADKKGFGKIDEDKISEDFSKGVVVKKLKDNTFEIDLYIIVAYGLKITEVVAELQKKVKFDLEQKFNTKFKAINVYVQGIMNI